VDETDVPDEADVADEDVAFTEVVDSGTLLVGSSLVSDGMLVSMVKSEVDSVALELSEMVGIEIGRERVEEGPSEIPEDVTGSVNEVDS